MVELLIGMLLGAMVSTETGRDIGNQLGNAAIAGAKKALKSTAAPAVDEHHGKEQTRWEP